MITYLESLNGALKQAMKEDKEVFCLGEDIVDPYGGAFKVTKGLSTVFPDRVLSTPISEACIVGMGTGMALRGKKPVIEIMFGDFLTLAADQIINGMCKFELMFGALSSSVVIRTPMGGGRGYGATHSQSLEKLFLGSPGLRIVAPSIFHDSGALLKCAVQKIKGPVLFIEHKALYSQPLVLDHEFGFHIKVSGQDFPTVMVNNFRTGKADIFLIGYGGISVFFKDILCEYANEEINISAILPSALSEIDLFAFMDEIRACGKGILVEEGAGFFGWTAEIATHLYEHAGSSFKKPLKRVMAKNTVIPSSSIAEKGVLPGKDAIVQAIEELLA